MREAEARCLFGYPVPLWPEHVVQVLRHERVYAARLPVFLKARALLPTETVCHGIVASSMPTYAMTVTLLCELPRGTALPGYGVQEIFLGWAMPASVVWDVEEHNRVCATELPAWLATQPHRSGHEDL